MEIAKQTAGRCRMAWFWGGKYYTVQGVEVPLDVIKTDEERILKDLEIAPDDQVLDMKVTLPAEALPYPYQLSPIVQPEAEPKAEDEEEEEEEVEVEEEEETPEGKKVVTKKTVKRKKAAKRK